MAVRQIAKGEHGYSLVFDAGVVSLFRKDGSLVYVSSWRACCAFHLNRDAGKLAAITTADWIGRRES